MAEWIAIGGLVLSAVGTGMSVASSNNAAKSQEQLALLNAQAQTQAARQTGRLQSVQAQVNAALAEKDKVMANAAAQGLERQAGVVAATGRENTRRQRAEFAVFLAQQRASSRREWCGGYDRIPAGYLGEYRQGIATGG